MEQVVVRALGNSQEIRILKDILDRLDIRISGMLQLGIENDSAVWKKVYKHKMFEEWLTENDGEISVSNYDLGDKSHQCFSCMLSIRQRSWLRTALFLLGYCLRMRVCGMH